MGNGDGQIHSITETNGSNSTVYLYRYDSLGNLVGSEKLAGSSLVLRTHHSYDTDNRLSAQGWQIGSDSFSQTYNYGEWDGNLSSIVLSRNSSNITVNYTYDGLRRLSTVSNGIFVSNYSYCDDSESGKASPRLAAIVHEGINYSGKVVECNYSYGYDINGNITSATFGNRTNTYVYDANNQLIRENNDRLQYTQTWEYDAFGNITATRKYDYTTGELGTPSSTVNYGYTDSNWGDLLTTYNGQTIEYDEIGNPLYVKNGSTVVKSYTWTQGRQLASLTSNGVTWEYTYDADGLRTGRTDGTNTYQYIYAGDKLVRMIYNGEVVDISYAGSQPLSLTYDGATYYYVLNGQGDVIGLTDSGGNMAIGYTYGAYGTIMALAADENLAPVLVQMNPLTYRGYVYDRETKFFYLQSRYYDPELGRFINADAYTSTGQGVLGNNMFAYCLNNPVVFVDSSGNAAHIGFSHDGQPHYAPWKIGSPGGGGWSQDIHYHKQDYGSVADKFYTVRALKFVFNTDKQAVIKAERFAMYRGQLVIKQDWAITDGRSFSFIFMFLHVDETDPATVKHEWGHYVQLWQMGLYGYICNVAIPSLLSDGTDPYYYSNPWERTADFWAGVDRGDEYRDGSLLWGFFQYVIGWPSVPLFYMFGE